MVVAFYCDLILGFEFRKVIFIMSIIQKQIINDDPNSVGNSQTKQNMDFRNILNYSSSRHELQIKVRPVADLDIDDDETKHPAYKKILNFSSDKVAGSGSFGVVFQALLKDTNEVVAIKKVLQDRKFKV
jgi:hypothetical protein